MAIKSVMTHSFSQVPRANIPRSSFKRSHGHKTTFDSGYLVPFYIDEVLPGDTFNLRLSAFARIATPIVPVMDNLFFEYFFFAVPNRLLWTNWQRFNGEQDNPTDSTDYLVPQVDVVTAFDTHSLGDYFGLPTKVPNIKVDAWFFRAYNLIWNQWFRDQNLQASVKVNIDDGPDPQTDYTLLRRGKRHDYFTSALPWPQKGPGVELPLGTTAPVLGNGMTLGLYAGGSAQGGLYDTSAGGAVDVSSTLIGDPVGTSVGTPAGIGAGISLGVVQDGTKSGLIADLTNATAATINSLREAFQLQRLLERDARGGSRYTEIIRSHFGVVSPDARLQRPEYLGGGSKAITFNPVAQTTSTDTTSPQGNLAAFGLLAEVANGFTKSFTEHCVIVGLCNVRADLNYQQGINRMFSRRTRFDFYWPALAHLGEQGITNDEIFAQGLSVLNSSGTPVDKDLFGYQERWAEYRYYPSLITGRFRSNDSVSLDIWHLAQDFADLPVLSDAFIQDNPPVDRIIAVPTEPQFLLDSYFDITAARPLPLYSVPGMIDHF